MTTILLCGKLFSSECIVLLRFLLPEKLPSKINGL